MPIVFYLISKATETQCTQTLPLLPYSATFSRWACIIKGLSNNYNMLKLLLQPNYQPCGQSVDRITNISQKRSGILSKTEIIPISFVGRLRHPTIISVKCTVIYERPITAITLAIYTYTLLRKNRLTRYREVIPHSGINDKGNSSGHISRIESRRKYAEGLDRTSSKIRSNYYVPCSVEYASAAAARGEARTVTLLV